ncbi:MAG: N-formylglutamate deformylase [Gammaproteobacteria bacterium]|nr:N-formylglutamate deformylase [Gammaproteobacteria bacterium]
MKPQLTIGHSPLLLAQPHGGTEVPEAIFRRFNTTGQALADTDWHITRLYADLIDDVTIVGTPIHRYVIDANRSPDDESLYPGENTTGLCPTTTFDGVPIYHEGEEPKGDEIRQRQLAFHQPYHDCLQQQLERLHQKHGFVILYDCHSIRSLVPYLFEDKLPDFNIGTNGCTTCSPEIESSVVECCSSDSRFTQVINGRFKGGWTTRHYGKPDRGYHAIQMELAQCNYMLETSPWTYQQDHAELLRVVIKKILKALLSLE